MEELFCPECGEPLSVRLLIDEETDELIVEIGCEGDGDDEFYFDILTGLTEDDISNLDKIGKVITKEMNLVLKDRRTEFDD